MRPNPVKSLVMSLADRMGFDLIPKWRAERNELAKHLKAVFARLGTDTVIDVGANLGQYHDFLRMEVGFEGAIHSFEPVRALASALERRAESDPAWTIHPIALGGAEGEMELNVMNDTQFSSLLAPKNTGLDEFASMNSVKYRQPVRVRRLDDVVAEVPSLSTAPVIYLKLDTQGFDLEVLKGASLTLRSVGALQTEASMLALYDGMPDYRQSIATLNALGFDISGMFPIARDHSLRLVEFDCVMVDRDKMNGKRRAA